MNKQKTGLRKIDHKSKINKVLSKKPTVEKTVRAVIYTGIQSQECNSLHGEFRSWDRILFHFSYTNSPTTNQIPSRKICGEHECTHLGISWRGNHLLSIEKVSITPVKTSLHDDNHHYPSQGDHHE
jgi:hypothetical protein